MTVVMDARRSSRHRRNAIRNQRGVEMDTDEALLKALRGLCAEMPMMSATGGWFPVEVIRSKCEFSINAQTVRETLCEMADQGVVEMKIVARGRYSFRVPR